MAQSAEEELVWGAFAGDVETVKEVLARSEYTDVNYGMESNGCTALYAACESGMSTVVELLLAAQDIDPNKSNHKGASPFYIACGNGHADVVLLLQGDPRVDCNKPMNDGATPFFIACQMGDERIGIVGALLSDPRIDVNAPHSDTGSTPFLIACSHGHHEAVSLLLTDPRIEVNRAQNTNSTPLWYAAQCGHLSVVQYLLASGRDIDTKPRSKFNGKTASEVARMMATVPRQTHESEDDHRRRLTNSPIIANLIDAYEKDVPKTRFTLRKQLGLHESWLEKFLGVQLSSDSKTIPAHPSNPGDVKSLVLAHSGLTGLPAKIAEFTSLTELDLSSNSLTDASAPDIVSLLKNNPDLTRLRLTNLSLSSTALHPIILGAHKNMSRNPFSLQLLQVDNVKLDSFEGFGAIPQYILQQGTQVIAESLRGVIIGQAIRENKAVKVYSTRGLGLTARDTQQIILALVQNFSSGNLAIESLEVDDMMLESFEGLRMIPVDILQQGTKKIVRYMLDLLHSPDGDPLWRSKLMVVGFESVGKTTILDCLFPLEGGLQSQGKMKKTTYWFKLQGNVLSKYDRRGDLKTHKDRVTILEGNQWTVVPFDKLGIKLSPRNKGKSGLEPIELHCPDKKTQEMWLVRLRRVCMNEATHGIEIQTHEVDNDTTREYFKEQKVGAQGKLSMSVWDFAGQNDYYNNHHYFLSVRTVFMVLWKISDGEGKGLDGLTFWFKSLANHLNTLSSTESGTYYSIVVVGTFLDHPLVKREEKNRRARMIDDLAKQCGLISLDAVSPLQYFEVSCSSTLENIDIVQEAVTRTALSHSYMGERVPKSYLVISEYIRTANQERTAREAERQLLVAAEAGGGGSSSEDGPAGEDGAGSKSPSGEIPIMSLKELASLFGDEDLVKRALGLLSLWGECVYFESPPKLASMVVLDPRFLAKGILADLFTSDPTIMGMKKNGVIKHRNLELIWKRFRQRTGSAAEFAALCDNFMTLLETLGVCFIVRAPTNPTLRGGLQTPHAVPDFLDQESIIPALLPDVSLMTSSLAGAFSRSWPRDPPYNKPVEIERILKFGAVVPAELVSRLLVHLHPHIQSNLVVKNEVILNVRELNHTQAWIRVEVERSRFAVVVRGARTGDCQRLLKWIVEQVREVGGRDKYSSVLGVVSESVRSPHSSGSEINLREVQADAAIGDLKARRLVCPDTQLPVSAERMLVKAGLLEKMPKVKREPAWWNLGVSFTPQPQDDDRKLRLIVEKGKLALPAAGQDQKGSEEVFSKFSALYEHLGGTLDRVEKVFMIENARQRQSFEDYRLGITEKHRDNEMLFRKEDWREAGDFEVRKRYLAHYTEKVSKFRSQMNDGRQAFVLPVVQGTSENAAHRIIKNGFGTVATTDEGFYGRGMYFTSHLRYASSYAHLAPPLGQVFLIALVIPGNTYPAAEDPHNADVSMKGMACKKGYQSHYVEVNRLGSPAMSPGDAEADELVVFEGWQTLPLFLVYTSEFDKSIDGDGGGLCPPPTIFAAAAAPSPWSFLNAQEGFAADSGEFQPPGSLRNTEEEDSEEEEGERSPHRAEEPDEAQRALKREVKQLRNELEELTALVEQQAYLIKIFEKAAVEKDQGRVALAQKDREIAELRAALIALKN